MKNGAKGFGIDFQGTIFRLEQLALKTFKRRWHFIVTWNILKKAFLFFLFLFLSAAGKRIGHTIRSSSTRYSRERLHSHHWRRRWPPPPPLLRSMRRAPPRHHWSVESPGNPFWEGSPSVGAENSLGGRLWMVPEYTIADASASEGREPRRRRRESLYRSRAVDDKTVMALGKAGRRALRRKRTSDKLEIH